MLLAIETSCDESAVTLATLDGRIIKEVVWSQSDIHSKYGGVVPELASRNHIVYLQNILKDFLNDVDVHNIEAFAATCGPGLLGGLLVGMMVAKGMAHATKKKFIAINHLEAHFLSASICNNTIDFYRCEFPWLGMLVSGGHCNLVIGDALGKYQSLGVTIDDAAGEAFDKIAIMLGMSYPGGHLIQEHASSGDKHRFPLHIALQNECNFSFSGLKTAVWRIVQAELKSGNLSISFIQDMCASVQYIIACTIASKMERGMMLFRQKYSNIDRPNAILCGGVASNTELRDTISSLCDRYNFHLYIPDRKYCTDNATMIASAGLYYYHANREDSLDYCAKARWTMASLDTQV